MAQRRIGLIGCGDVSVVHVEAIEAIDGLELVGVADVDPAARERAAAELSVPTFATAEELIEQLSPDAVHVTTPHDQHVGPSLAARGVPPSDLRARPGTTKEIVMNTRKMLPRLGALACFASRSIAVTRVRTRSSAPVSSTVFSGTASSPKSGSTHSFLVRAGRV